MIAIPGGEARAGGVLGGLRRRALAFRALEAGLLVLAVPALAALALIALDAGVVLPAGVRAAAPWGLAAVAAGVLYAGVRRVRRLTERRLARVLEENDPALGTTLTNAVELAAEPSSAPAGEWLRRQAVAAGRTRSTGLAVWPVVRAGAAGAVCLAAVVAALWLLGTGLYGEVFRAVLPRFTDPHGDHPPYSRLVLHVQPKEAEVLYGGQCEIRAVASGRPVERLYLAAESGGETSRTVMFRAPDKSFFQTLANLREPATFWVTDGRARSRRFRIRIRKTPQITLVETTCAFPAYTGRKTRTASLKESELRLPKGTRITFRAASNRPLRGGTLRRTPLLGGEPRETRLVPDEGTDRVVAGSFTVEEGVAWALTVEDVDGLANREPRQGRITILPDRPPRIHVIEPGRQAVATPDYRIPVHVRAEDDYGVSAVLWFRGFNRSVERPGEMAISRPAGEAGVEAKGAFSLADLGVRPGDRIDYFFEATDNWPDGPHVATSRMYSVQIISEEAYRAILRNRAAQQALFEGYQALSEHMRRLAERAEALEKRLAGGAADPQEAQELTAELGAIRKELERYRENLDRVLEQPKLFDIENAFRKHLEGQKGDLARAAEALREAAGGGAPDREAMKKAADLLREMAGETRERVSEPAKRIASVAKLLNAANEFTRLAQRQKELARLARRFEEKEGALSRLEQMELREIAARQRAVRDALDGWREHIPELVRALPPDTAFDELRLGATTFVQDVEDLEIPLDLAEATDAFGALDGPRGCPPARTAAEKMMSLVKKAGAMQGQGASALRFQPQMGGGGGMGDSLEQILNAMQNRGAASGANGYGLYGDDVGLYGPDVELAGEQGGDGDERRAASAASAPRTERTAADADDDLIDRPDGRAPVRLRRDVKFPLRYRDLVGEYFRVLAEEEEE